MKGAQSQRLPFLDIQNKKKNENSNTNKLSNKSLDQNVPMDTDEVVRTYMSNTHNLNIKSSSKDNGTTAKDSTSKFLLAQSQSVNEEKLGDCEYQLCLKKALKEAIDENDMLREKMQMIIKENKDLKDELEEKTNALIELAQFYEYCQAHHKEEEGALPANFQGNKEKSKNAKNKRKSKSL